MPKFSIIIPVYNVAPYLRECLDSVVAQTCTDWEAVCVDDGSTDGSAEILNEYEKIDRRINVLHQQNAGVSVARNAALAVAKGTYAVFLDGDDLLVKECLTLISQEIMRHNRPDVIRYAGAILLANDRSRRVQTCQICGVFDAGLSGYTNAVIQNSSLWLYVFSRRVIAGIAFPPGVRFGEDDVFLIRAMPGVKRFIQSDCIPYIYRYERPGAASRVLTCNDMAVLLEFMAREFPSLMNSAVGQGAELREFYKEFSRKEISRVRARKSREGIDRLRRAVLVCIARMGRFDSAWSFCNRLWLWCYLKTGSMFVSDVYGLLGCIKSISVRLFARRK